MSNRPKGETFESGKRSVHPPVSNGSKDEVFFYKKRVAARHPYKKRSAKKHHAPAENSKGYIGANPYAVPREEGGGSSLLSRASASLLAAPCPNMKSTLKAQPSKKG